ncbi:peptidylprolyl isomerase [Nitrospirota bacterium]
MTRNNLLSIFMVVFLTMVTVAPAHAVILDRVIAVVNKESITWLQLHREIEKELAGTTKGMTSEQKRKLIAEQEMVFLEGLIMKKIQLHEAARLGMGAGEQDADMAIESIRSKYNMSIDAFRHALEAQGVKWEDYRASLIEQIAISRVVDRSVRSKVRQEIQADTSTDDGSINYVFRQIFLSGDVDSNAGTIDTIKSSLGAGLTFESLVQRYSQDSSASEGGLVGPITGAVLSREFRLALAALSPGQVSRPFQSKRGVHIIELIQSRTAREAREEEFFQKHYAIWLQDLKEKAFVDIRLEASTATSVLTPSARSAPVQTKRTRRKIADEEGGSSFPMGGIGER